MKLPDSSLGFFLTSLTPVLVLIGVPLYLSTRKKLLICIQSSPNKGTLKGLTEENFGLIFLFKLPAIWTYASQICPKNATQFRIFAAFYAFMLFHGLVVGWLLSAA